MSRPYYGICRSGVAWISFGLPYEVVCYHQIISPAMEYYDPEVHRRRFRGAITNGITTQNGGARFFLARRRMVSTLLRLSAKMKRRKNCVRN
jgi:hypothetical protein